MKKSVLLSLLCMMMLCSGMTLEAQTDAALVTSTVSKSDIEGHIYFLASDELKGRQTGSDELDIAAAYIANTLRKFGVKPVGDDNSYYQNVPMEKVSAPSKISVKLNDIYGEKFLGVSVKNIDFNGDAIFLDFGSKADFEKADVKGKLVIVKAGNAETKNVRSKFRAGREKRE